MKKYVLLLLSFGLVGMATAQTTTQPEEGGDREISALDLKITNKKDLTKNAGKVEWLPYILDFGEVPQGKPVTRDITVKNISQDTLRIERIIATCACTDVKYTTAPAAPGQSATIRVVFDAQKPGDMERMITVKTNFDSFAVPLPVKAKVVAAAVAPKK